MSLSSVSVVVNALRLSKGSPPQIAARVAATAPAGSCH
jgi:hypothetical protein